MPVTVSQGLQALLAGASGFSNKPGAQVEAQAAAQRQQAQLEGEQTLAKLKNYLQGQEQQRNTQSAQDLESQYMKNHPGFHGTFRVGPNGTEISENQAMPMGMLMQDRFLDKQAEGIADKAQKEGIPQLQAQTDILKQDMAKNGGHLQSVGPIANYVPDSLVPLAQYLGKLTGGKIGLPDGSAQERQDLAALRNATMHAQFGSRQTEAEKSMLADQLGLHGGNSSQNVEDAISNLGKVADRESNNVTSGMNPEAVRRYKARGGNNQVAPLSSPAPQQSSQPPVDPDYLRYQQLLQKAGMSQ